MSFVKRFQLPRRMIVEARMDVFNILDTINFNAIGPSGPTNTTGMGSSVSNWQVTSAASDVNASQGYRPAASPVRAAVHVVAC